MKEDATKWDLEYFRDMLWASVGFPENYYKTTDELERIARRRKRIKTIKDIYEIDGKARD